MLPNHVRELLEGSNRALTESGLYPTSTVISGVNTNPVIQVAGREVLQFCTGNYLGLATHPTVTQAVASGLQHYGLTASGSRLVCGTLDVHVELERELAEFEGEEDAAVFFLVTVASSGILNALRRPQWHEVVRSVDPGIPDCSDMEIFMDQYTHPTAYDACCLADRDRVRIYRHCDMADLEKKLQRSAARTRMIVTDGLFSAQGDLAPLPEIVELAQRYGAMTFVDDSHASFVLGERGRGTWELLGVEDEIDFKVGSMAKALSGGLGGFLVGGRTLIDFMRVHARHLMFGGSIPPAVALGLASAIRLVRDEPWRRERLLQNATYLRERLNRQGFDTLGSVAQILPILIGEEATAMTVSDQLLERGILVPCFRFPATPRGKAILRVNPTALHTREQLDYFLETFLDITSRLPVAAA